MIPRMQAILASAALMMTLSACHPQKAGHGEVSGQILPGSVSDAMLPYDAVKSHGPLAPERSGVKPDTTSLDSATDNVETAATVADSAPLVGTSSSSPATPTALN